ncbi:Uncharacterised protein [Mycobacteroides abscessus subsp. abscessus]|nr:Uncharacterised protein [Mycobacteroides abscessus subsp. abscessus]
MDFASSVESFWEPVSLEQLVSPVASATVLITTNSLVHCVHQIFTGPPFPVATILVAEC